MDEAQRSAALRAEVRYFHNRLFGDDPPREIEAGYVRAHEFFCLSDADDIPLSSIVDGNVDVEALELVLRKRGHPVLTRKLRILLYLLEVAPAHYARFHNTTDRPVRAWFTLGWSVLRTAYKYAKGLILLRRHPIVARG